MVDKDKIQRIAEDIAETRFGSGFYDLPQKTQDKIYAEAEERQLNEELDRAEALQEEFKTGETHMWCRQVVPAEIYKCLRCSAIHQGPNPPRGKCDGRKVQETGIGSSI